MAKKIVNPKISPVGKQEKKKMVTQQEVKKKLQEKGKPSSVPVSVIEPGETLSQKKWLPWVLMIFLFVFVSLLYFPVAFQHMVPPASDTAQWEGAAHQIIEYNKTHKDPALWTQSMFSGMPSYMISFPNRYPFLENITRITDKVINWRIFLLFVGALGMFLLLRYLKLDIWACFLGAVAFMFSCHWMGLLEIGHNTKFRAIMYIPWVIWALIHLRKKPGSLGLGFLSTTLIMQLRENHPQITYYLYLFVGLYWIWQLIVSLKAKDLKKFWQFTGLLILAFLITVLAVMNPYLSTWEYSKYTPRGSSGGLETSYAQQWSFHPLEIVTLIIPNFFGGVSPDYWGYMPFTQTYNYFGIVVLALAIIALCGKKHRKTATFLGISSLLFLIMSFGSATPHLSNLFLKYLPYFNKFRVPSMILVMVQILAVIMAGLGLDTILSLTEEERKQWSKGLFKAFWICGIIFLLWLILAKPIFGGLPFASAQEKQQLAKYNMTEIPADIRATRLNMLYTSGILSLLLLTVSIGLAYLKTVKKLPQMIFVVLMSVIVFIDLYTYTGKFLKKENLQPVQQYKDRFAAQDYDEYLLADNSNYRIYPIEQNIISDARLPKTTGEWAYHHQIVTGYSAAKLARYDALMNYLQDSVKGPGEWRDYLIGIFSPEKGEIPREKPTNIMDMLSVKYMLHPEHLPYDSLLVNIHPVFDGSDNVIIYKNNRALPRAWFVDKVQKVAPADSILPLLREETFNPRNLAYVETDIKDVQAPDSCSVVQTVNELHKLAYDVYTDKPSFLVLSEVYYPAGWKAKLDDKEIPIYPANYVLRGLQIPAGQHKLELVFAPESYTISIRLSLIGLLASLLTLIGGLIWNYNRINKVKEEKV